MKDSNKIYEKMKENTIPLDNYTLMKFSIRADRELRQ
jgi:hypothetical protein